MKLPKKKSIMIGAAVWFFVLFYAAFTYGMIREPFQGKWIIISLVNLTLAIYALFEVNT